MRGLTGTWRESLASPNQAIFNQYNQIEIDGFVIYPHTLPFNTTFLWYSLEQTTFYKTDRQTDNNNTLLNSPFGEGDLSLEEFLLIKLFPSLSTKVTIGYAALGLAAPPFLFLLRLPTEFPVCLDPGEVISTALSRLPQPARHL